MAILFLCIWILYIVHSEQIVYFICKSLLGRDVENKSRKQKYIEFYNEIVPACKSINDRIDKKDISDFEMSFLYNSWCNTISFILDDCCISRMKVDSKIIFDEHEASVADFRKFKIDKKYIDDIILLLNSFISSKENDLTIYDDLNEQKGRLKNIYNIFMAED